MNGVEAAGWLLDFLNGVAPTVMLGLALWCVSAYGFKLFDAWTVQREGRLTAEGESEDAWESSLSMQCESPVTAEGESEGDYWECVYCGAHVSLCDVEGGE